MRGGTYYLSGPLILAPDDSGTKDHPVRYAAYPGEKPILSGGRPVYGWHRAEGDLWTAQVGANESKAWSAQQLFVDCKRQIRARHPNFDPVHPTTGGYLFARTPANWPGGFGACVGSIHNPGDFLEYDVEIPADGQYAFWVYYGADNKSSGGAGTMDDRTQVTVDGGAPVPLKNLPDTGGWGQFAWGGGAFLQLTQGKHAIRWTNAKGGGLNLDAFALCDVPQWNPVGTDLENPDGAGHLLVLQCERFDRSQGKQMSVDGYVDQTGKLVYFDAGTLHAWPKSPDKLLHIFMYEGGLCSNTLAPIASIDEGQSRLTTAKRLADYRADAGARFFVDNVREALDSPGEWYLDRVTGLLTYWPLHEDFACSPVVLSVLDSLIELNGDPQSQKPVEYIHFEGFGFEATGYGPQKCEWYQSDHSAVWLRAASHCRFAHNRFVNLGGAALVMVGSCCENEVVANEVAEGGAGGISINGNPQNVHLGDATPGKPAHGNRVCGNHIHHTGLIWKHGNPICLNSVEHSLIAHNSVHDVPRMGILATKHSGGNVIECNEIRRANLETGDSGGIYLYWPSTHPDANVIRNNLVVDSIGMGTTKEGTILSPCYTWGIYLDGETSNTVVRDNIVVGNVRGGIFFNGGHKNVVENNIFANASQSQAEYSNYTQKATGNVFRRNIITWTAPEASLFGGWANDAAHLDSDYNLYWHNGLPVPDLAQVQRRGLDGHSTVCDPQFVDSSKEDYRLKPNSPVIGLDFQPIDTSRIGPKGFRE